MSDQVGGEPGGSRVGPETAESTEITRSPLVVLAIDDDLGMLKILRSRRGEGRCARGRRAEPAPGLEMLECSRSASGSTGFDHAGDRRNGSAAPSSKTAMRWLVWSWSPGITP